MLALPTSHSRAELDLARRIADRFDSEELFVFWTGSASGTPAEREELPIFGLTIAAIGALFESLTSTIASLGRTTGRS